MKLYKLTPGNALSIMALILTICVILCVVLVVGMENIILGFVLPFAVLIFFSAILLFYILLVDRMELKNLPKQKEWVKVVDKRQELFCGDEVAHTERYITFEFRDGSRKEIRIGSRSAFNLVIVNDTGIFTYKERENKMTFIGFEKDQPV